MNATPTDIDDIITLLKQCDDSYFNTELESPLSDREYDTLKRRAFLTEPSNEYFIKVGSDIRGGKIKLPYQMGSLNQVYEGEVYDWVSKYELANQKVVVSDKLDGVSCLLVYNNGALSIAYSRGNGIEGADVTRHVKMIPSVPLTVSYDYLVVRAEVIMKKATFIEKYSGAYKNPRNLVAGVMNRKENELSVLKDVELVVYEIVAGSNDIQKIPKTEMLDCLEKENFTVVDMITTAASDLNDKWLSERLSEARGASEYELDGLVVTANNHAILDSKSNSSSLNPEHSIKYKVLDDDAVVETFVVDVHWEISKNGLIKPRVEVITVELFGTSVKFATGFNAKFIVDNGIGKGAKIKITKAGMVIPQIVGVIQKATPIMPPDALGKWEFNETGVDAVLLDKNCEAVVFKQVLDFFETYRVELLKEASLREVWKTLHVSGYKEIICDICDMTESEWIKTIGANGSRIYNSIRNRLSKSAPETFLGATAFMGVGFGVRKAKMLLTGTTTIDNVWDLTISEIEQKEGFDTKTATMIVNGLPATNELRETLVEMEILGFVVEQKTTEMTAVNVVMTGFRDSELHSQIESMGGKVSTSVSKNTTHLLCLDPSSKSSKMTKARDLGVTILSPDDFRLLFNL